MHNALVIFLPGRSIPGQSGDFTFTREKSFVYFPTTQARIKTKVPGYGALQIKDLIILSFSSSFDNHFVHGNSMPDNVLSKIVKFVKFYFFWVLVNIIYQLLLNLSGILINVY